MLSVILYSLETINAYEERIKMQDWKVLIIFQNELHVCTHIEALYSQSRCSMKTNSLLNSTALHSNQTAYALK